MSTRLDRILMSAVSTSRAITTLIRSKHYEETFAFGHFLLPKWAWVPRNFISAVSSIRYYLQNSKRLSMFIQPLLNIRTLSNGFTITVFHFSN